MMKGFVKKGLVLLALGILFAGCATDPSEESSSSSNKGVAGVPMTLDPVSRVLTIGDGSAGWTGLTEDGHTISITTEQSPCPSDGGDNSACDITLHNLDSDEYMANTIIEIVKCGSCSPATRLMDNFDLINIDAGLWDADGRPAPFISVGPPPTLTPYMAHTFTGRDESNSGAETPLVDATMTKPSGIVYLSDTYSTDYNFMNPMGAPMFDLSNTANAKPKWMIAPLCGKATQTWDFGGSDLTLFPFWAAVKSQWFPINPLGADGVVGGGDDDNRFNFAWFDTTYITVTDMMADDADSTWRKKYRPGSIYRSNVLAGYKPTWARGTSATGNSIAHIPLSTSVDSIDKYFSVNIAVESSDWMEAQDFGNRAKASIYYYTWLAYMVSWDPTVLTVPEGAGDPTSWELINDSGISAANFQPYAQPQCVAPNNCFDWSKSGATDVPIVVSSYVYGPGYIGISARNKVEELGNAGGWSYFAPASKYTWYNLDTETSTTVTVAASPAGIRLIPKSMFMHGYAKIRCGNSSTSSCIIQDYADTDPEFWLYNVVMKVQDGQIGNGSEIKLESFQGITFIKFWHNRDGKVVGQWDPVNTLVTRGTAPFTGNFSGGSGPKDNAANLPINVTDPILGNIVTLAQGQFPNPNIKHFGPAVIGGKGTYQAWNVVVCVE